MQGSLFVSETQETLVVCAAAHAIPGALLVYAWFLPTRAELYEFLHTYDFLYIPFAQTTCC